MKKTFLLIWLFTTIYLSSSVSGQPPVIKLQLDEAVQLALEKNHDLRIAALEVKKSEKKIMESIGNLFPSIEASGQYTRNIKKPVIFLPAGTPFSPPGGGPGVLEIGSDNAYVGAISVSMPLYLKSAYEGIRLARQNSKLSEISEKEKELETVASVKKAFYTVLLTRNLRDFLRLSMQDAEDNLENVRRMHQQGLVADYDLIKAEVQVENLRPALMQAEDNYRLALDALKISIGLDSDQQIEVVGELVYDGTIAIPEPDQALQDLLSRNFTLQKLQWQGNLARTGIALAKAEFHPSLIIFVNYQYQTQANDFRFADYYWVKTSMIGLQLRFPIFKGMSRIAKVQEALLTHRQILEQQSAVSQALKTQLQSILYRLNQTKKRIEIQQKSIQQAELGYRIALSRYKNGLGTQLEVNDAEVALTQARFNYSQAVYDFYIALVDYEFFTGKNKNDIE